MKKAIILIGALLFFAGCDYKKLEGGPVSFCESETTNIANGGGRISFVCINKQKYVKLYSGTSAGLANVLNDMGKPEKCSCPE